jgi:phospholipid transport system substrate-binding protein
MRKTLKQLILLTIFIGNSFVIAAENISAHEYAKRTHNNIIVILQTKNALFEEDSELFVQEISNAFSPIVDFERIARNVMGKHYKVATSSQRGRFSEAFRTSLLNTYSKTLIEFRDEKIIVLPPESKSKSSNKTKVYIEIITSSKRYPGVYSMYLDKNNEWKIINIVVNGINLGLTFRSQFYSLMENNNNDISAVIDKWIVSV